MAEASAANPETRTLNFIEHIVEADNAQAKWGVWTAQEAATGGAGASQSRVGRARVHTRFPPEPNGYLHLGHAASICLNFGLAKEYAGQCNLRFDDTNPAAEDPEFVESIKNDVRWLGFDWDDRMFHASDYFDRLYEFG